MVPRGSVPPLLAVQAWGSKEASGAAPLPTMWHAVGCTDHTRGHPKWFLLDWETC